MWGVIFILFFNILDFCLNWWSKFKSQMWVLFVVYFTLKRQKIISLWYLEQEERPYNKSSMLWRIETQTWRFSKKSMTKFVEKFICQICTISITSPMHQHTPRTKEDHSQSTTPCLMTAALPSQMITLFS